MFWHESTLYSILNQVVINLSDENDNPPMFERKEYDVTIEDRISTEPPALITRVGATDPDIGIGGELLYSIVSGNTDGAFQLDPKKGFIKPSGKIPIWNMPSKPEIVELKVSFLKIWFLLKFGNNYEKVLVSNFSDKIN